MREVATLEEAALYPGYVKRVAISGGWALYYPGDDIPSSPVIDPAIKQTPSDYGVKDIRYYGGVEGKVKDCAAAAILSWQDQGRIYIPYGNWLFESPITVDNNIVGSPDPYYPSQYAPGINIYGDGYGSTQLFCGFSAPSFSGATALGLINLPAATINKYRMGARIADLAIYPLGSITRTHGILMSSNYHAKIERVKVQLMPGSGFYSPLRSDLAASTDAYQNSSVSFEHFYAKACGQYGIFGESGGGMAGVSVRQSWFYDCYRTGVRIGGVLVDIDGCAFANCGSAGTIAGVNTGGLIIDKLAGNEARNCIVKRCEFESNYGFNFWLRSCFGFESSNLRVNSQFSADGGATLKAGTQILLGAPGTAVRAARFLGDVSKSPPSGDLSSLPVSMYKIYNHDVAGVEIYDPVGTAGGDNTSGFVLVDTSVDPGTLDGVRWRRDGVWYSSMG